MHNIAEPPRRFSSGEDYTVRFQCGCEAVFLASCFHRSSRMTCCSGHNSRDGFRERQKIYEAARRQRDAAELMAPPV
jgi:hypothetical protein